MDPHPDKRDDWAASPVPSAWLQESVAGKQAILSVDPVTHARVRALPVAAEKNQQHRAKSADDDDDDDEEEEDLKQRLDDDREDLWTEMKAPSAARPQPLVAPQPRRVVSPELIFSSAAER